MQVEDLRKRLKEKEVSLEKKSKQATQLAAERRQYEQEAGELREQSDLREKRLSLLQRKVNTVHVLVRVQYLTYCTRTFIGILYV